jgi:S-adenosylmethionine hydrolase
VAVVDPGVGTARRGLAARLGRQYFVGPDNGLCTLLARQAAADSLPCQFFALDRPQYWLPDITHVFHGRDIFAPVAGHLAAGIPIEEIGSRVENPVMLDIPEPAPTKTGWRGTILHIDHFGNLTSNLNITHLDRAVHEVHICGKIITGVHATYGSAPPGTAIALFDDSGFLEIAVSQGSAEKMLGGGIGTEVEVLFKEGQ